MKPYRATASARIAASAERVYNVLADYRNGHPFILPRPYFLSLDVEQGGFGAGTIINFKMRVMGQTKVFRAAITEREPGRLLVETNLGEDPFVTTFLVAPVDGGRGSDLTITTEGKTVKGGLLGSIERSVTERYLERIFKKELKLIAEFAMGTQPAGAEYQAPRARGAGES